MICGRKEPPPGRCGKKIVLDFYKNKKVFLTGAKITGYALNPPTTPSLFLQTETEKAIRSITGDIRDKDCLIKAMREAEPDLVFHLAAQPIVRISYREPADTYAVNVMGTVNILEAVRLVSSVKSFINVTTDKVYENREWHWGYRENENLCGHDPYSNSKSCSELVTYSYRNSFFYDESAPSISTARSGNVIGGGDYAEDRIIPDCIRSVNAGKEIAVRNPRSIRPYQHVLECLSGYLLLAEKQHGHKTIEGAYNFGPDDESCVATGKLAELFCAAWGHGAAWQVHGDDGPHEANFLKLECSRSKAVLGWKPRWDIKTAVEKTVEFAKAGDDKDRLICVENQIREYFKEHHV